MVMAVVVMGSGRNRIGVRWPGGVACQQGARKAEDIVEYMRKAAEAGNDNLAADDESHEADELEDDDEEVSRVPLILTEDTIEAAIQVRTHHSLKWFAAMHMLAPTGCAQLPSCAPGPIAF